jgi:hypothetical protein
MEVSQRSAPSSDLCRVIAQASFQAKNLRAVRVTGGMVCCLTVAVADVIKATLGRLARRKPERHCGAIALHCPTTRHLLCTPGFFMETSDAYKAIFTAALKYRSGIISIDKLLRSRSTGMAGYHCFGHLGMRWTLITHSCTLNHAQRAYAIFCHRCW